MKLLSIIIPIYNVEPFIEKCLRSLEAQDIPHDDYEIICINDGSPDNSRKVVLRLQEEFNNIILIDQENQGVSQARNKGIDKATGKFLLFVDPDDLIQVNSLDRILNDVDSKRAQIATPGYTSLDLNGNLQILKTFDKYEEKVLRGIEAYNLSHEEGLIMTDLAVGIIFETDFLNKNYLRYLPDVPLNQDLEFIARVHCLADRCVFVKHLFYTSVARQGSATRSNVFNTEKARNGFILAASNLKKFQHVQSLNERQKLFLNGPTAKFVLLAIYSGIRTRSINNFKKTVNNLMMSGLVKLRLEGCKGYYIICGKPYNLSPYLGALVLVLYLKIVRWYNSFNVKERFFKKGKWGIGL